MRLIASLLLLGLSSFASAIEPKNVFLIVNKNEPRSRAVADHYCELRRVPAANIIELDLPGSEDISRADYETKMVQPLREKLQPRRADVKVLVSTYGVPLRVGLQEPNEEEQRQLVGVRADLTQKRKDADERARMAKSLEEDATRLNQTSMKGRIEEIKKEAAEMQKHIQELEHTERRLSHAESLAAVDSELMQLWWPSYPTERWIVNPYYWQMPEIARQRYPQVLTSRLDGPTLAIAKSLVTDAIWAEENGLKGRAYVDARGIPFDPAQDVTGTGYGGYDESMREAAQILKDARFDVKLDNFDILFSKDSCPDAAIYCGWYSVRNYVPCCRFNRGAIAWHLASFEMLSIRFPQTQWCGNLLMDSACVTLGPVAEPYTIAFPKPAEFFGFVASGEFTMVECYARSLVLGSWMSCLIGDPLYNPYKKDPRMKSSAVKHSPKGSKFPFAP